VPRTHPQINASYLSPRGFCPALRALTGFILLLSCPPVLRAQEPVGQSDKNGVDLIWDVKIPMRDGVKLNATIYKPKDMKEPLPVVFTLTPYIADTYHPRAMYFARNGYVFALVDVRGRGNSEGRFVPWENEARDGYDIVEWLAQQPWSNGKVAMWGGSYAGFDQWATLKEIPPHLKTIVPAAAAYAAVDFPFLKNIFSPYEMQWLTFTSGVTPQNNLFGEFPFWTEKNRELYMKHLPFKDLDQVVGNLSTHFQDWLKHPTPDAYWEKLAPSADQYKRINVPILTITGHYDGDQRGALQYYRMHMKFGDPAVSAKHYLIIGPWDHAGTRTPDREVGGLKFAEAGLVDLNKLHRGWYDWTMKDGKKPEFLKKRVAYYVTASNPAEEVWKYADSLEAVSNATRTLYLQSDGHANDVFHSGTLGAQKPGPSPSDHYVYDPLDTRPAELERQEVKNYLTDQRDALNLFGDGLVYHSEPFTQDTEVTGYLKFVVWIAMDVPDTDFAVSVDEVRLDGTKVHLTDDLLRARYRESLTQEKLVQPGEVNQYQFNTFQYFSRRIAKGSRLRLLLGCPNSTTIEKNYNSGGVVAEESGKDARTAHITVYHDAGHPSSLELPVVQ
jgi:putative CocE/NonD family hydrolase